ncbi:MAG: AzlD domain-containing protein [Deferrisomatales bacterium]|nr:AzlD domain-containing protein [Deferrisomatales bacterium]
MSTGAYLLLLVGMAAATYLPRAVPLLVLSGRPLPPWMREWLELVPVALLAALVTPAVLATPDPRAVGLARAELWVALPTLAFAWKTRSLGGTVVAGMLLYWLAGHLR